MHPQYNYQSLFQHRFHGGQDNLYMLQNDDDCGHNILVLWLLPRHSAVYTTRFYFLHLLILEQHQCMNQYFLEINEF